MKRIRKNHENLLTPPDNEGNRDLEVRMKKVYYMKRKNEQEREEIY